MNFKRITKYIFAGGIATFSNLTVLFICVNYFKIWYLTSAVISFSCGVIVSYLLQKFFVFENYSKKDIHKQFMNFLIYNLVMLGVNTLLMYLFVNVIGFLYLLAQVIAALITAFLNYNYFRRFIFNENVSV